MPPSPPPPRRAVARPRAALLLPLALLLLLAAAVWQMLASGDGRRVVGSHERGSSEATGGDEHAAAAGTVAPPPIAERTAELQTEAPRSSTAHPADPDDEGWTPDPPIDLPATPVTLHVIDRTSGAPLAQAEVRYDERNSSSFTLRAWAKEGELPLLTKGASPLLLQPDRSKRPPPTALRVDAPGYASDWLRIDWHSGGERTVALWPSARLTIQLTGAPDLVDRRVQLYSLVEIERQIADGRRRLASRPAATDPTGYEELRNALENATRLLEGHAGPEVSLELARRLASVEAARGATLGVKLQATFERVPAGRWIVAVFQFDEVGTRTLHAVDEVDLAPGDDALLPLAWQSAATPPLVTVTGRVVLGPGWLDEEMPALPDQVAIRSLDPLTTRSDLHGRSYLLEPGPRADTLHFAIDALPPGPAVAWFKQWRYGLSFEVPHAEDGAVDVELHIPSPAIVTVQTVAPNDSREPVASWVDWIGSNDGRFDWMGSGTEAAAPDGTIRLVVPAGHLTLGVGYDQGTAWHDFSRHSLSSGPTTIERSIRTHAQLAVTVRDGKALVPLDFEAFPAFVLRGSGIDRGAFGMVMADGSTSLTLLIDGEGPATLIVDGLEGYRPSEPIAVELVRGETVHVEVALRRMR
ncbi:MAG: hypothetical protein JNL90_00625 [Planctomycetes bacterium]|nr:hypothetical protein [Planctomycetota bacterium]